MNIAFNKGDDMRRPSTTCSSCGRFRFTTEPCVYCNGSPAPGRQKCATCFSFDIGKCRRIRAEVEGWWTGCMLHVPSKLSREQKSNFPDEEEE